MDEVASIKGRIDELDGQQGEVEAKIREAMSYIPNIPQPGVPEGKSSEDNVEVRVWGVEPAGDLSCKPGANQQLVRIYLRVAGVLAERLYESLSPLHGVLDQWWCLECFLCGLGSSKSSFVR